MNNQTPQACWNYPQELHKEVSRILKAGHINMPLHIKLLQRLTGEYSLLYRAVRYNLMTNFDLVCRSKLRGWEWIAKENNNDSK